MSSTQPTGSRRAPVSRTFRAFEERNFRLLWPSSFLTYVSRWSQVTLLAWFVLSLTDSPWLVALVGFFGMAPMFVLGLLGGVLADTADRRTVIVITQAATLAAALIMAALLFSKSAQFWHAYLVVSVTGTAWALEMPTRRSLIHDLVGSGGVTNAVALDSMAMSASLMLGPALAGALITVVDVSGSYVVVCVSYAAALTLTLLMRLPGRRPAIEVSPNPPKDGV